MQVAKVPTSAPESDGTAEWSSTTIVIVHASAGGVTGLGYSYVDAAAAAVIRDVLADHVVGLDAMATGQAMARMLTAIRNHGRAGIGACAISAVDVALWDLKARCSTSARRAARSGARARAGLRERRVHVERARCARRGARRLRRAQGTGA